MRINIGDKAPDFSLFNTKKEEVSLSILKGKQVLLLFFPAAFTSTCTRELCSVRDDIASYNDVDAIVFGISTDSVYTLIRYKEEQNLNFELLSDYNREVCERYGARHETFNFGMKGVAKRAAFIVNESGVITYAEIVEKANTIPDFEKIKAVLSK